MTVQDRMNRMKGVLSPDASQQPEQRESVGGADQKTSMKSGPQTAPGGMLAFRKQLQDHETTVKSLEEKLAQFEGEGGVRTLKLDTSLIDDSAWANRHPSSFESAAFDSFKDEIEHAGGNIQPILVRPVKGRFEIVFGHRRYTACKQLGLQVMVMIMEMSDEELFTLMDRENRARQDLSPFEQGVMWNKAIVNGLFSSGRQLASHLGVSNVHVNQCVAIARLPEFVLELFVNPTEIQVRWAKALNDRLQADPESLAERAKKIKAVGKRFGSAKVFDLLTGEERAAVKNQITPIKHAGQVVGKIQRGTKGDVALSIKPGFLSEKAFVQLQKQVGELIGK